MENQFQIPLDLPDVRIIEVNQLANSWLIRVESTLNGTSCCQCGRAIRDVHGDDAPIRLRHLPLFEVPVWIELRPKRYRCPDYDGRTTTQRLSWYQQRSPHTKAYDQWLLRLLINATVSDVSRKLAVSEAWVVGVLERCWVETEVNWHELRRIEVIGLDEISSKRGHRDFVAIITPQTAQGVVVLGVLDDCKQATVEAFSKLIPADLKATIQTVCLDMHVGYVNAVQAQLPQARIVVDRFHVAQAYRDCADTVRKQALKRLKQALPKAAYADLKGVMWACRKRPHDLDPAEKTVLNRLFVFTNYFLERQSSGFVEGFNNRIKVLKRRCYGIFNVQHIFQRLTLDRHGYERFGPT